MGRNATVHEGRPDISVKPKKTRTLASSQTRTAWLLLLPTIVVVLAVAMVPLAQTIWYSFTNARLASIKPTDYVGLKNYRFLMQDTAFRDAIWTTVKFTVITVVFEFVLGHGHRAGGELELQRPWHHARRHARAVGHPDRHLGPDVEVDVQPDLRRFQ